MNVGGVAGFGMFWWWRTRETNTGDFCQDAGYHAVTNTRMVVHSFRQPSETARCGAANQRTTA